jgi:hypothetical protein
MGAQIFHRISFGAIVNQAHQKQKIQRREKQYVASMDDSLGILTEPGVILKPPRFQAA